MPVSPRKSRGRCRISIVVPLHGLTPRSLHTTTQPKPSTSSSLHKPQNVSTIRPGSQHHGDRHAFPLQHQAQSEEPHDQRNFIRFIPRPHTLGDDVANRSARGRLQHAREGPASYATSQVQEGADGTVQEREARTTSWLRAVGVCFELQTSKAHA